MLNTITNTVIDTVQSGKKQFVSHFVKHEKLSNVMNEYIDLQTQYTKNFVNGMIDFGSEVYGVVSTPGFTKEITENYGLDKFTSFTKPSNKKAK